jgi:ATP-binding cassette, subfamily B, bacterial
MTLPAPMIDPRVPLPEVERPRGMRERLEALRYLPQLVRLVWQTHRGFTAAMIVLRLVRAFVPVATLWVAKLIIDQVVLITRTPGTPLTDLWRVVALELAIVVVGELLARASALVESSSSSRTRTSTIISSVRAARRRRASG